MNYIGMDIHKQFTVAVAKDRDGNKLAEDKFENSKENFRVYLSKFPQETTKILMESTCVWEYIFELIEELGYSAKLSNPVKTKAIAYARIKTDSVDASTLADLLRANLVAESYVPPKEIRNMRNIMRQRKAIVKGKTQIKNKIHAVLLMNGIKIPYKHLCNKAVKWVIEEIKTISIKSILVSYVNILEQYNFEVKIIDEKITDIAQRNEQANLLMTIPGIGPTRAMEIIAEIGEIHRFPSSNKLASYAGLVPSIRQSGSTLRFGKLIKQSSKALKSCLIEASWCAVRTREENPIKLFYKRLSKKKGKQKAICAAARKMCSIVHAMLTKQEEFRYS